MCAGYPPDPEPPKAPLQELQEHGAGQGARIAGRKQIERRRLPGAAGVGGVRQAVAWQARIGWARSDQPAALSVRESHRANEVGAQVWRRDLGPLAFSAATIGPIQVLA